MRPRDRAVGASEVLLGLYALFVVAAGARSAVQLGTHAGRAPLAYALSALAAVVYAAGFVLVRRVARGGPDVAARSCCVLELAGVLVVGALSVAAPDAFPDDTVWSRFGAGYLFVPLALPVLVLMWLRSRRHRRGTAQPALE